MKKTPKYILGTVIFLLLVATKAVAETGGGGAESHAKHFGWSLLYSAVYGCLGILLVTFGFKFFDFVITRIDLEKEIAKGNVAAAVLSGAAILGISIIMAVAIL